MQAAKRHTNNHQQGFVLITGLLVLLMLTVIMLTALRTAALEERMAGNLRNSNVAFQAGESALRDAESIMELNSRTLPAGGGGQGAVGDGQTREEGQIQLAVNPFNPFRLTGGPFQNTGEAICLNGFCGPATPPASNGIRGMADNAVRTAQTKIPGVVQPQYVVELMFVEPSTDSRRLYATFRVTTRAWGEDPTSLVQLQSTYRAHLRSFVH